MNVPVKYTEVLLEFINSHIFLAPKEKYIFAIQTIREGRKMIRTLRIINWLLFLCLLCGISQYTYAQSITSASGIVKDSITGEPLSYVSVLFKNTTIGAMTDDNGGFSLQNSNGHSTILVSSMGYTDKEIKLRPGKKNEGLNVLLRPTSYELSEVVIKPKREKYSRKDNPAVELIKKVIAHKNDNRIESKDQYQVETYEKLSLALDNFNPNLDKNKFTRKFKFIKNYLDTSEFNGKPILTLSVRETLGDPEKRKEVPFADGGLRSRHFFYVYCL